MTTYYEIAQDRLEEKIFSMLFRFMLQSHDTSNCLKDDGLEMTCIIEVMISMHSMVATSLLILLTRPYRKALFSKSAWKSIFEQPSQLNLVPVRINVINVTPLVSVNRVQFR